jgi:cell division protein FtsB
MAEEKDYASGMKDVIDKLSTVEDLQNMVQLDVINLRNEIEKIRLTFSGSIASEADDHLVELQNLAKDVDLFKRWKQTVDEVRFLRDKVMLPSQPSETAAPEEFDELRRDIEQMRMEMQARRTPSTTIDLADLKEAIEDNKKAVENLKFMISDKSRGAMPDLETIKRMVTENRRLIDDLRVKVDMSRPSIPSATQRELENLHAEVSNLETEVHSMKDVKPGRTAGKGEIENLKTELYAKLDDLNTKFGPKSSDEIKRAMEANRASLDKIKSLVSGEETTIESLKREMDESRKFVAEVKNIVLSKNPQLSKKMMIPPDPEVRKKMLNLEQKIEFLGRKIEKMSELKPIKLPEFAALAKGTKGRPAPTGDTESLRREIDTIVSRMDGFLTKDDVEKGFLEKRMKADEKLLTGEIYKDLNDIKKAIMRGEDHINSVATDVEGLKKEVVTVEKREWGKVSEIPAIDDLKKRIDELERKIDEMHEGPVFIE